MTGEQYRSELMCDAFIAGMLSVPIRQRLLENRELTFRQAYEQARAQEMAHKNAETFKEPIPVCSSTSLKDGSSADGDEANFLQAALRLKRTCYFCGQQNHPRNACPAKEAACNYCYKVGHFSRVCRKRLLNRRTQKADSSSSAAANCESNLATISALAANNSTQVLCEVTLNGISAESLMDTGSSDCYKDKRFAERHSFEISPSLGEVTLAETSVRMPIRGQSTAALTVKGNGYSDVVFNVLNNLATNVIIGEKIFKQHEKVVFSFEGDRPTLTLKALSKMIVPYLKPFSYLSRECRPVADRTRKYSKDDQDFICQETKRLLNEDMIEPSSSPWRAQVVVVKNQQSGKRRMVIDYRPSRTINRFTQLDAYPLPQIEEIVSELSKFKVFTTIDLKSAYHQIELNPRDREYTAFQSGSELYQWRRLPFGLTNAVPEFQRAINSFVEQNKLKCCFPYLDDITVAGIDQADHDRNLRVFYEAAAKWNLTINDQKTQLSKNEIALLGYRVAYHTIKPDPDRVQPLLDMPVPKTKKELQRIIGLFAYYARWIPNYSDKIRPLIQSSSLPLNDDVDSAIDDLKQTLATASLHSISDDLPLTVETDASDFAIAATLNQNDRPVAFHSRTLSACEQKHSAVEKEAYAVVEALRKWRHLLLGRHFTLLTDQKSVSYMLDTRHASKIKNEKIMRWRIELSSFCFTIVHRPGKENVGADTLSRAFCGAVTLNRLRDLHVALCHPGVTRMAHYVRTKNLPYSLADIREMTANCECLEIKPQFVHFDGAHLIKATQLFERLNLDLKGPLPSVSKNRYFLTIVDEYSRFSFAFPCSDMVTKTIIMCLTQLFSIFGMCSYIHSDRYSSFQPEELKQWLNSHGVATSRTTSYNPKGNGQCEKYNGVIWKAILAALKSRQLLTSH